MESNLRFLIATLLTIGLWSTIRGLEVSSMPEIITRNGYSCKKVMDRCHENHHYCYNKNGYYVPCDRFCPPTQDTASSKARCLSWCEVYFDLECFPATSMQTTTKSTSSSTSQYTLGGLMGTTAATTGTLSVGEIAGIVIGVLSVLSIIITLIVCRNRLKRTKSPPPSKGGIRSDKQEREPFVCSPESASDGAADQITNVDELPGGTKVVITGSGSQPDDGGLCVVPAHNGVTHNGISTGPNTSLALARSTPAPSELSAPDVQTFLGAPPGVSDDSSAPTTPAANSEPAIPASATFGDSAQPPPAAAPTTPAASPQPAPAPTTFDSSPQPAPAPTTPAASPQPAPTPTTPGDSAQPAAAPTTPADSASRPTGSPPASATGNSSPPSATGDSSPGSTESPPSSHTNGASSRPSSTNTDGTGGGQQPQYSFNFNAQNVSNVNINIGNEQVNNYSQANRASSNIPSTNSNCSTPSPTTVTSQPTTTEAEQPTNTEAEQPTNTEDDGDQTPEPATDSD